jgi:S1-C subfamily serine protease
MIGRILVGISMAWLLAVGTPIPSPIALAQSQPLPTNATTVIWFFRTKSMTDSMLNPTIYENGLPLAKMEKGQYFGVVVQPGTHYFSWTDRPKSREQAYATVRVGEQVFFRVKWRGIAPVDAATWKREVANLRPIESKNVLSSAITTAILAPAGDARIQPLRPALGIELQPPPKLSAGDTTSDAAKVPTQIESPAPALADDKPKTPVLSSGTGFLVHPDGLLITAFHVVEASKKIEVRCGDLAPQIATLKTASSITDLAVLRIPTRVESYLTFAPKKSASLGTRVFSVGYPLSDVLGIQPKYTEGTISGLAGPADDASLLQISTPVQPGNSGGALVNDSGEVVGVVTSTASAAAFLKLTGNLPQNISWAVKSEYAAALIDEPAALPPLGSRQAVINRAIASTCMIVTESP